jgi:hypothetical protein
MHLKFDEFAVEGEQRLDFDVGRLQLQQWLTATILLRRRSVAKVVDSVNLEPLLYVMILLCDMVV